MTEEDRLVTRELACVFLTGMSFRGSVASRTRLNPKLLRVRSPCLPRSRIHYYPADTQLQPIHEEFRRLLL